MAFYLGKGTDKALSIPLRRRQPGTQKPIDYISGVTTPKKKVIIPGQISEEQVTIPTTGGVAETTTEAQPEQSYTDRLLASLFGKEFETLRGAGQVGTENVMETLARQGLLGTGAVRDIASEQAWGTERNIADVLRAVEETRYTREQDALNQLLTYFFTTMGSWGQ